MVWSEFYSAFGSGSDIALAKPLRVQREYPPVSSWMLFWLQLSGFCREGWCWRLLSCPGSVRREGPGPSAAMRVFWGSLGYFLTCTWSKGSPPAPRCCAAAHTGGEELQVKNNPSSRVVFNSDFPSQVGVWLLC